MMKKMLPICLLLFLCLTGCSSKADPNGAVTIKWENGVTSYNGTVFAVDEYNGYSAYTESGEGGLSYTQSIDSAKDVTHITVNAQGVEEENMTKYKGCFWYTEYLGSMFTMAKDLGNDNWSVCQVVTNGTAPELCATYTEHYVSNVPLTNGQVYVDFGSFIFGTDYDVVIVRPTCALITGVAKVSQGTYDCNTPVSVMQNNKEYQLMKGSSAKYDYYMYDGYLIQLSAGLDPAQYIKFK